VREAYNRWEARTLRPVRKVFKGMNAWTENYSALRAEVPDPLDEGTALNTSLIGELGRGGRIVIAGEASSHCVRATTEHLVDNMDPAHAAKIVLLSDCMNPVAGFEAQAQEFLASMRNRGASVMRSDELAAALVR
jgi:nicotinamidase-related amidase